MNNVEYIKSIKSIGLKEAINHGTCAYIYQIDDQTYFKLFNSEYHSLRDSANIDLYNTLLELSNIKLPHIVTPTTLYRTKNQFYGYTMPYINAFNLSNLSSQIQLNILRQSFENIKKEVLTLSKNYIKTEDISLENVLFNHELYLIDLDLSLYDRDFIPDYLYHETMFRLFEVLIQAMILHPSRYNILMNSSLSSTYIALKDGQSDDYDYFFNQLFTFLENKVNTKIDTVASLRLSLEQTKML